jgi:NAD(P)-dependent dehydrogenase (short-subunit alcohol dehydrogenase family)
MTGGNRELFYGSDGLFHQNVQSLIDHIPLGRPGTPDEIAHAALFLATPENNYLTGHILVADGGWIAGYHRDF